MATKKIMLVLMVGWIYTFAQKPDPTPRTYLRIRVINEDDIKEIFPGDIKIVKMEIEARQTVTIEKFMYVSGTGLGLVPPLPSYGKKTLNAGEVMFMEFKIHATIGGWQSFGIQIFSHDEKGNPDPGVASAGGFSIYNRETMRVRSADDIRYGSEIRYGTKESYIEELLLAEKTEKVQKGPPIRFELAFIAGSGHTLTLEERVAIQRDLTGKNTPRWYKDWIFSNHWYKEWIKQDWQY